jgi:cytochrome-b5 reductase
LFSCNSAFSQTAKSSSFNMAWRLISPQARTAPVVASLAAGGIGLGIMLKLLTGNASAESNTPRKIFKGGPSFVSLSLDSSEAVNHNTKRLRFKLPQQDAISGLPLTCKASIPLQVFRANSSTATLLTISWPKGSWVPVPRPYTPVSASGELSHTSITRFIN